jgi:hypothetical protein
MISNNEFPLESKVNGELVKALNEQKGKHESSENNLEIESKLEKRPSTKLEKVKEIVFDWSKEVAFQAYPKVFNEKLYLVVRIIWAIVFLGFSGVTCFLCVQSLLGYLQWNTVSTIQIVREAPTKFPAITICDSNPFTSKTAQRLLEKLALQKFNINITTMNITEFNVYRENLTNYAKIVVNSPDFSDDNRKLLGFSNLSSIVLNKRFDLKNVENFDDSFIRLWHANFGNCYQFNTGIMNASSYIETKAFKDQSSEGDLFGLYLK